MTDLAQGYSAKVSLSPGQSLRVSAAGSASVQALVGAPSGTTPVNGTSILFGPYDVTAQLRVTAVSGTTSYGLTRLLQVFQNPEDGKLTAGGAEVSAGSGAATGTLRQIATKCGCPSAFNPGSTQQISRSSHMATSDINGVLELVFPNFRLAPGVETPQGAVASITAAIEKMDGTVTQILFSGAPLGSIPNGGVVVGNTAAALKLVKGEKFFVRTWYSCAAGILYGAQACNTISATDGDAAVTTAASEESFNYGASIPDTTMTAGYFASAGNFMYRPLVIAAVSSRPAVLIYGDSKSIGQGDLPESMMAGIGEIARSLANSTAYSIFGIGSETLQNLTSGASAATALTVRSTLHKYFTHVVCQLGTNDIHAQARTAAQFLGDMATFCGKFTIPVWWCTISPRSTSTDSWATVGNQTAHVNNAVRVAVNDAIRQSAVVSSAQGARKIAGFFEMADALESARNSGLFKADGGAWTGDGIHENQRGYIKLMKSRFLDPAVFGAN